MIQSIKAYFILSVKRGKKSAKMCRSQTGRPPAGAILLMTCKELTIKEESVEN